MINASETIAPKFDRAEINSNETIAPENTNEASELVLLPGECISDSYIIHSLMNNQGKQSDVYLAKRMGKSYVLKVYHEGMKPSLRLQNFLKNENHPNVTKIIECGEYRKKHYEIYEYYHEGTLEDSGPLNASQMQDVVIPSINEGLHELHKNGIVHCDIKPSNLFWADNGKRLVIGDCGVSGYTNETGKYVDSLRGTPEYAPRVKALLGSAAMSSAYDYGSFGLVLCKAILGKSLFSGMSLEEISRAWENGINLPQQISGRMRILIEGLIKEEEDQRWEYEQVKRWCEGEYFSSSQRTIYTRREKEKVITPLIFGCFDNQMLSVSTLHQLENAIKAHWEQATRVIKRSELIDFLAQFDPELANKVRELSRLHDLDTAVFKLLLYISDDKKSIFYAGKEYLTLDDYVNSLESGIDETARKFLLSGLLAFYLRENHKDNELIDKLESITRHIGNNDRMTIKTICYALKDKKEIEILGEKIASLEELIPQLCRSSLIEISELLEKDYFIAWLNKLGYEKDVKEIMGTIC